MEDFYKVSGRAAVRHKASCATCVDINGRHQIPSNGRMEVDAIPCFIEENGQKTRGRCSTSMIESSEGRRRLSMMQFWCQLIIRCQAVFFPSRSSVNSIQKDRLVPLLYLIIILLPACGTTGDV